MSSLPITKNTNLNNDLFIPNGVTFVGIINVPGLAQINGDITGEITCKELDVGPEGNIKGKVQAQEIQVHGQLENDINCVGLGRVNTNILSLEILK